MHPNPPTLRPAESHIAGRGEIHGEDPASQASDRTDKLVVGSVVKDLRQQEREREEGRQESDTTRDKRQRHQTLGVGKRFGD